MTHPVAVLGPTAALPVAVLVLLKKAHRTRTRQVLAHLVEAWKLLSLRLDPHRIGLASSSSASQSSLEGITFQCSDSQWNSKCRPSM